MDKMICGHDRGALIEALGYAKFDPDDSAKLSQWQGPCDEDDTCLVQWTATQSIHDPAKLAEMLAERGRELGLGFWHGPNEPREPLPADYVLYVLDGVIRIYSPLSPKTWQRQCTMVQARAILLAWLQLPDVPRDASKGDEFGQCDECGDGIDPPSDTDDLALSAWESDHPGEQVSLCEFDTRWLCVPCLRNAVHDEADLVLRGES